MTDQPSGAVLLVDDEATIRDTAARVLRRAGFQVFVAADAAHGGTVWAREKASIAVLVTDLELGEIDGVALALKCREDRADLPVVLTSGYSVDEIRAARSVPEDCRFLPKPFTAAELLELVRSICGGVA
jgi:two-component system, cell cycle sensor histidine kinase and response regulator CckA